MQVRIAVDLTGDFSLLIFLNMSVDFKCCLNIVVPRLLLNLLNVHPTSNQICDVCMSQDVRGDMKIYQVLILMVPSRMAILRIDCMYNLLTIDVASVCVRLVHAADYAIPHVAKLCFGHWISVSVGKNILGGCSVLMLPQVLDETI